MPHAIRGGLAAWQVRQARDFIEDRLAEDVSLAELARLTRLSPTHFCSAFKRSVGLPPHQYQLRRRIERAKALLADPDRSVSAIGFVTSTSFTCFYCLPCASRVMRFQGLRSVLLRPKTASTCLM